MKYACRMQPFPSSHVSWASEIGRFTIILEKLKTNTSLPSAFLLFNQQPSSVIQTSCDVFYESALRIEELVARSFYQRFEDAIIICGWSSIERLGHSFDPSASA
jgi:hypothetical protein